MKPITVKALIAELAKLDANAIVLVPTESGFAKPLSLRCDGLMLCDARPKRRSKIITVARRRAGDRRLRRYRVRWTDYELRRYGHTKPDGFKIPAIFFNIHDDS